MQTTWFYLTWFYLSTWFYLTLSLWLSPLHVLLLICSEGKLVSSSQLSCTWQNRWAHHTNWIFPTCELHLQVVHSVILSAEITQICLPFILCLCFKPVVLFQRQICKELFRGTWRWFHSFTLHYGLLNQCFIYTKTILSHYHNSI